MTPIVMFSALLPPSLPPSLPGGRVAEPSATAVDLTKKKPLEEKEALKINKIVQMLSR